MEYEQHTEQFSEQVNAQARHWFMLMQSETVTESERKQRDSWLAQAPEHVRAYQQLEVIWQGLGELAKHEEAYALKRSVANVTFNTGMNNLFYMPVLIVKSLLSFINIHRIPTVLATFAIIFALVFMMPSTRMEIDEQYYATNVGELKPLVLNDGSEVTLGAKSRIKVSLSEQKRQVTLLSGEAFFDVTKDKSRPFVVIADQVAVEVVGTQFDVRKRFSGISVAVQEGIVNVNRAGDVKVTENRVNPIVLKAGQRVRKIKDENFSPVEKVAEFEMQAWRSGRLIYRNTPLADLIADINRYYDGSITLKGQGLAEKKITLTLHTDKIDLLPMMLRQTLPVAVDEVGDNFIVISNKK